MNRQEKEEYLREYSILKAKGKPFFPYAVAKDSIMACVVMATIILLSLFLGAELGSKANPTTTTYVPRPGVVLLLPLRGPARDQAAEPRAAGDDRRSDDLHDPAVPAAVLRPRSRAPAGAPADRDDRRHRDDHPDGLPHLLGRDGGFADGDRNGYAPIGDPGRRHPARRIRSRQEGRRPVGAAWRATRSATTATPGRGRTYSTIGERLPRLAIARTLVNPTAPMPSFKNLPPQKFNAIVSFLSQLQ